MTAIQRTLPLSMPFDTPDPFLFCVYHKDSYPAAISNKCEGPRYGYIVQTNLAVRMAPTRIILECATGTGTTSAIQVGGTCITAKLECQVSLAIRTVDLRLSLLQWLG